MKWNRKRIVCIVAMILVTAIAVGGVALWMHHSHLEQLQNEALAELERNAGQYDEQSIVLYETSRAKAEELAKLYGAKLRITENGRFATLTLPEGTTIRDVYALEESRKYIDEMAADYQVQVSELTEDKEDAEDGEKLPQRPQYSVSDTDYELQTYLDYLNMGTVWNQYTGSGITVAVIDTGIDTDHPEFAGRISEYSYNATEDKIVKDYNDWSLIEDEQGHGTAVTGVIAASMDSGNVVGIAPNVEIIVIKAECDAGGNFYRTSDLVYGLYYAIERDVNVVNMSFGTYGCANPFAAATQLAYDSDIICVAAAGNNGTSSLMYPAADENVIGVGALDGWELADYSNYGENVDLCAPGTTYTSLKGGQYGDMTGTSLSSPVVAGAIALLLQNNPYTTFDEVTEVLYASCYDLGDLGRDWYYGFGALDISALVWEERGKITYDMLTDELDNLEGLFIQGHTLQELPEPERLYAVFDGWYYDDTFTQEYNYYTDKFYGEVTLYAKWANEDDGIPYTYVILDDGTVEIRSYTGHRRYITIPEKIEGRVVSSIGDFAFDGQTRLREVTLPSGLTHIGLYAFQNCANLVSIHIPENVTEIEDYAFSGNVRLSAVAFAGNSKLTTIGDFAFADCGSLERIELPASLENINGSAFYGATALHSISVQKGNTAYQSKSGVLFNLSGSTLVAFPAAYGDSYTMPEETVYLGSCAFAYTKLKTVDLQNVQSIGDKCFMYSKLQAVGIPDSVTALGKSAFYGNENLTRLSIGRGLTTIAPHAFAWTSSLKTVTIPKEIAAIEDSAFVNGGLESVIFEENSTVAVIGESAFAGCGLPQIDLPASILMIDGYAFAKNPLMRVGFAENSNLHTIGNCAFSDCWRLETIQLPASLRTIGDFAFQSSGLKTVVIPADVTSLGDGAFSLCSSLTAVAVESGNAVYHDLDGVVYTLDNTTLHTYPAGREGENYRLESTVQIIAPWAFAGSMNLFTGELPEGLTQISEYAFAHCGNLQYVNIPDNVVQIGRYAFAENWNLYEVHFSETSQLPRLSYGAFAYSGISSFRVPANVSTMAQGAFEGCRNLSYITFAENSKLESISAYMFDGCTNLQSIVFELGSALTSIQAHGLEGMDKLQYIDFGGTELTNIDNFAFRFCESLYELNLPETLTNIGRYAFYGCKSLSRLTVPVNVEHIGSYALLGTRDLELYFVNETLPLYLDENWDYGMRGYYTGVSSVEESGEYRYAVLPSGNISILEYLGNETHVDLTQVDLGGKITTIGGSAFEGSSVTSIVLPDTLTAIQAEAFAYSALKNIHIPENVTFIGRAAFAHTPVSSVTFAQNARITVIEQYAFEGTENLTAVTLPASLTTLGTGVFLESGLQSVVFEQGIQLEEIPQKAFAETKLTDLVLPDSVTLVNHNAFNNVQTLKQVTFGSNDGIRLMSNAFYHTGLEELHIPANVTYIGEYCFVALGNLTAFTVDENNPNYKAEDGLLMSKSGRKLIAVPAGRTGSLTVPKSVEEIGFGAFEESKLSEILFHTDANILTFGYRAFFKANGITTITIPKSVVSIDYYAFAYCENLREVIFTEGNQLKGIYEGAFCSDINLENITIPDSVVEISDFAFYGCSKITKLPISENNQLKGIYDYAFAYTGLSGEFTTPETLIDIGNYAFLGNKFTKVTIPDTNKKDLIIGIGAFEDCNQLTEITLPFIGAGYEDEEISWFGYIFGAGSYEANGTYVPESLKTVNLTEGTTTIYTGGFAYCKDLETINMPYSVSVLWTDAFRDTAAKYELTNVITAYHRDYEGGISVKPYEGHFGAGICGTVVLSAETKIIGNKAFADCKVISDIVIPESVAEIDGYAFYNSGLEIIHLPSSVTRLHGGAFAGCADLYEISIPSSVTTIEPGTFHMCTSLAVVNLPNSITSIETGAFENCYALEKIVIPDSVATLGDKAFSWCYSLKIITVGSGTTHIGSLAFEYCNIQTIYNRSSLNLELDSAAFGGIAAEAKMIVDRDGNKFYSNAEAGTEYVETNDQFLFRKDADGGYTLLSYIGEEKTITLPVDVFGCEYSIKEFAGGVHVIIPEGRTAIDEQAFYGCKTLQSISIPDSVTSIGIQAFAGCTNLSEIKLPGHLSTIAVATFDGCDSLSGIEIPYGVEKIESSAFQGCASLSHISIPNSVTAIDTRAFFMCDKLARLEIPDSVTSIGAGAFSKNTEAVFTGSSPCFRMMDGILYNDELTKIIYVSEGVAEHVVLPSGITAIDANLFADCDSLKSIVIPEGVTFIGLNAFENCANLETVVLPDGLEIISQSAFQNCKHLKSVIIPDSVTFLGGYAFGGCSMLEKIVLSKQLTIINFGTFHFCESLYDVTLPTGITAIEEGAFYGCGSLVNIAIPDGVTHIGDYAFRACSNLESISIPNGTISINSQAFLDCGKLRKVGIPGSVTHIGSTAFPANIDLALSEDNTSFVWLDGVLYDSALTTIVYVSKDVSKHLVIPEGVTEIPAGAFMKTDGLTSVTIPDSVTYIDTQAFMDCKSLRNVIMGKNVAHVGESVFNGCSNLVQITLSDSLTEIGWSMFYGCSGLTSITIPQNVMSINTNAFNECIHLYEVINKSALYITPGSSDHGYVGYYAKVIVNSAGEKTYLDDHNFAFVDTESGFRFAFENGEYTLLAYLGEETVVTLPSQVNGQHYDIHQFAGADAVHIPANITQLSKDAFIKNAGLMYISADPEHTAFFSQDGILYTKDKRQIVALPAGIHGSISIANGVTSIDSGTFENCIFINSVFIPDSVTAIYDSAFYGCSSLTSITIPKNVTYIGAYAFTYCVNLSNLIISEGVEHIGEQAFEYCFSLERVDIPNSVTFIGSYAFRDCMNLATVSLLNSQMYIGEDVFSGCRKLFNNPQYYKDGMWIIDQCLIRVDHNQEYLINFQDIMGVFGGAYSNCDQLKNAVWGNAEFPSNVQTLFVTSISPQMPYLQNTFTLKNIVICNSVNLSDLRYCPELFTYYNVTDVTIYVEAMEEDLRWDDNFPGWSNGNKVVYGDEWHWVNFYDENGSLIYSEPCLNSQIIRLPIHEIAPDEKYTYEIVGWDLDGDGEVDNIPATTVVDLDAKPVVATHQRLYVVQFADAASGTVYHECYLPYGATITAPAAPSKQGHDFLCWQGLHDGLTVSGDLVIYADWQHHGNGHVYDEHVWVNATCTEPGYNKHICTICGEYYGTEYTRPLGHEYQRTRVEATCTAEGYTLYSCNHCDDSYRDDFAEPKGHSYGDWVIDVQPQCEVEGSQHRDCSTCGHREETTAAAKGHAFKETKRFEATCRTEGVRMLRCADCGMTIEEILPLKAHTFVKLYAPMSFIEWLLRELLHTFWGYEGETPYFYACRDCLYVMHSESTDGNTAGIESTACRHKSTTWVIAREPDCVGYGVETEVCDSCNEVLAARAYGEMGHNYVAETKEATCTEAGYTKYSCPGCGDSYVEDYVEALGHDHVNGVCQRCGAPEVEIGDVNGDGRVNVRDARVLLRYVAGLTSEGEVDPAAADFNGDGRVNVRDARAILIFIVGLG